MIKKIWLFSFVLLISISVIATCSDVKKAKEFMDAGMYPQAISLLEKRVSGKPTDAEAHYELGVCYINTGNFRGADQRFDSAVKLKPDYGYKIGGEYQKAGNESLKKNSVSNAISLFRKAVEFQPSMKDSIAQECFDAGKSYLDKKQSKNADRLLSMAVKYNPSLNDETNKITREYGLKLLQFAKKKPKKERRKYVDEAKKYVTQKDVDGVLPPPSWKTVYGPLKFTGKGLEDKNWIKAVEFGKNYRKGDKLIIKGGYFEAYRDGGWQKCKGYSENINKTNNSGVFFGVKTHKGKSFTVEVQRLIKSY